MKRLITAMLLLGVGICITPAQENVKLAQTGFKFMNVSADPRAVAMGEAVTSVTGNSMAQFYNPAGMARMTSFTHVAFSTTQWIADINHQHASLSFAPFNGDYGVLGFSLHTVDYGLIEGTVLDPSQPDGYSELGDVSPTAFSVGAGYARALSDRFSVGGNINFVHQDLGKTPLTTAGITDASKRPSNTVEVLSFDFGMLYNTGYKSLNFAMSVRNFSKEVKFQREGFQLPLIFRIGISMNAMEFITDDKGADQLLLSVDATHPRDYPEQINIGAEYTLLNLVAVRTGYMFNNDENGFTAGVGIRHTVEGISAGIDYAYAPFGIFGNVNRLSIQLSL